MRLGESVISAGSLVLQIEDVLPILLACLGNLARQSERHAGRPLVVLLPAVLRSRAVPVVLLLP